MTFTRLQFKRSPQKLQLWRKLKRILKKLESSYRGHSQLVVCQNIVNRGTGYETLPWKQWCCNLCWKGRDPAQSFVLTFTPQLNILTKTFRLVSCSNTFQILLLLVQGQGQKGKQKHTTKKFVSFHNNCLWLNMVRIVRHCSVCIHTNLFFDKALKGVHFPLEFCPTTSQISRCEEIHLSILATKINELEMRWQRKSESGK